MSNCLTLRVYWKPRHESIGQCADRFLAFMMGIRECDSGFVQWYRKGRSRKDALMREIDIENRDELLTLLDKGRHRRDIGTTIMEDLGFSAGIWNGGDPGKEVSLRLHCGMYYIGPGLTGNSVVLDFPETLGELANPAKASRVLSVAATCWGPDRGEIVSSELKDVGNLQEWQYANWMVYIPQRIGSVPSPSTVTHLENGGSIIVVQPNPPSVDNLEDQERIRLIEDIIHR